MKSLTKLFWNTETGNLGKRIDNVVNDKFTLNKGFVASSYYRSPKTIIKEVRTLPYNCVLPPWWATVSRISINHKKTKLNDFIQRFTEILSDYIYSIWDRKIFHVVLHSSGWDSRILSSIILDLYHHHGDEWLGDIIFLCFGEESKSFQKIMKVEGWNEDQYISLSKLKTPSYLESNLDFDTAWKRLNGPADCPISNCYWALDEIMRRDLAPSKNTELWGASYFNEIFSRLQNKRINQVSGFLKKYYYSRVVDFSSAIPVPVIQPLLNLGSIRHILQSKVDILGDIRQRIIHEMNPELSDIPRIPDVTVRVPTRMGDKLIKQYKESWYGKRNKNKVRGYTDEIKSSPWWSHWTAASLCEWLNNER